MEDQVKDLSVELDRFMINSIKSMIISKIDELKDATKDEDLEKAILHVEKVTYYTIRLRDLERRVKNNTFNGHFINAEMTIVKILESIVKDIESAEQIDNRLKLGHIKLNIYEGLNQITAIMEKYL